MDPLKTGRIISEARKKKGLTQTQLSRKLHVSDKAVSKWERGLCFPDISLLIPLTEILDISLFELLKGEKMKKEEVEDALKETINYSNKEIKKNKKRALTLFSIVAISIIIFVSITLTITIRDKQIISSISSRDTLHNISTFSNLKTNSDEENTENILSNLALDWKERIFDVKEDKITIKYNETYKNIVKAYGDIYVKKSLIYNASVLFVTMEDINKVVYEFKDEDYSIAKKQIQTLYKVENLSTLNNEKKWDSEVLKKLHDDDFVNDVFGNLFK